LEIRIESAPVDAAYNHPVFGIQMTGGSTTTAAEWDHYRQLGAAARLVLVAAAAQQWKVDASTCRVEKGAVLHSPTSRKATYGSLVGAAVKLPVPADVPLKDPRTFTLIGKPTRRLDTPSKTNGTAQFGIDDGFHAGYLLRFGTIETRDLATKHWRTGNDGSEHSGECDVQVPTGVAVIAERFWPAKLGREKLKITWEFRLLFLSSVSARRPLVERASRRPVI
jgi:isoquinoline 1-oxidoreductase subunit beta